jgi:WD40 repeat protein/serine/threonine protein kinase
LNLDNKLDWERDAETQVDDEASVELDDDPETLSVGTAVDHFTVMRHLSRGGMGEVYLARDTQLGRRVALKLVRSERLGSSLAVTRFLQEARTTAKFSHPNIVTIHAVGEHDGRPYVALEYLEGQNLRARMSERQLSEQEAVRIVLAVAEALGEAHRHGVLHLDLKPENIVIAADGRPRVVDFGMARSVGKGAASVANEADPSDSGAPTTIDDEPTGDMPVGEAELLWGGTAAYMAPEQWRHARCTATTDVWAVGLILFEMRAGRLPFEITDAQELAEVITNEESMPALTRHADVSPALTNLVERCLAKAPSARPSADEVASALRSVLVRKGDKPDDERNPFRGLLPFTERHADFFYGREAEIAAFVERLRVQPILPLVGPSGAGKSSFVRAGVVPRLCEQEPWIVLHVRPGSRPFSSLAARLLRRETGNGSLSHLQERLTGESNRPPPLKGSTAEELKSLTEQLHESPHELALELRALAEGQAKKVLLVIDQLEELFTLVDDSDLRKRFMDSLCCAADDPADPIRVVFTVRDDFLGRIVTSPAVREVLAQLTVIQPLDSAALKEVLRLPVQAAGYRYEEPEMVDEMVEAVFGEPSCLPLLQFAARRLWEERHLSRKLLLRSIYNQMGGVEGALATHADGVLDGFSAKGHRVARALMLRLVTPERTRRVAKREALLEGLGDEAEPVLERLTDARLLSVRKMRGEIGVSIELAHESLVHAWSTLSRWLDAGRNELVFAGEVAQAAALWDKRGRRPDELWSADALADALRTRQRFNVKLPELSSQFLGSAKQRESRRAFQRRAALAAAVGLLAAVAVVLAFQKREADFQKAQAQQQRAEALREGARAALGQGKVLEARAKLRVALEYEDSASARAIWWRLSTEPLVWNKELGALVYDVAFSPDGHTLAAACMDGAIYLIDARSRSTVVLRGHQDQVSQVRFSPDGRMLASTSYDTTLRLWDVSSGKTVKTLRGHTARIWGVAWAHDGKTLATGSEDKTVRVWDVASGKERAKLVGHKAAASRLAFSADDEQLATGSVDGSVRLWNLASNKLERELKGHDAPVWTVAFNPSTGQLATAGEDQKVILWDMKKWRPARVLKGHSATVFGISFSPDGKLLASAGADKEIHVWDVATGQITRSLRGHTAGVESVRFSPDGSYLASAGDDHNVRLWSLSAEQQSHRGGSHDSGTLDVAFSPDGKVVASSSYDRTVRLWSVATGELIRVIRGHTSVSTGLSFSPDGGTLASAGHAGSVRLWDVASGVEKRVLYGHSGGVEDVEYSPRGHLLASAGSDNTVRLWDPRSGETVGVLRGHTSIVASIGFSPDGSRLVTGSGDGSARVWDVQKRETLHVMKAGAGVGGVAFGPKGKLVAVGDYGKRLHLLDVDSWESKILGKHEGRIYWLAFNPAGGQLGTASSDGSARLWNPADGSHTSIVTGDHEVNGLRFNRDGSLVGTTGDDSVVRLWDVATRRPHWRAPVLLGSPPRLLTQAGWTTLAQDAAKTGAPEGRWAKSLEAHARFATASPDGALLCMRHYDDTLALWHVAGDELVAERKDKDVAQLVATPTGCVIRTAGGQALLYARDGASRSLVASEVTGVGYGAGAVFVAAGNKVHIFNDSSAAKDPPRDALSASAGIVAIARSGPWLVVGYRNGNIELLPMDASQQRPSFSFERAPASRPEIIVPGPPGTVVLGYANGVVGIWSEANGTLLASERLHGRVVHLRTEGQRLYAVSELGQHLVWELEAFYRPYCELLHNVWADVPVVWHNGQPTMREPDAENHCRNQ